MRSIAIQVDIIEYHNTRCKSEIGLALKIKLLSWNFHLNKLAYFEGIFLPIQIFIDNPNNTISLSGNGKGGTGKLPTKIGGYPENYRGRKGAPYVYFFVRRC